ncbi:hypothetical protein OAO87_02975, partial [bacterium]|nr:hypothetical protein [bacterium]
QQEGALLVVRCPVSVVVVLAAVQRELAVRKPGEQAPWSTGGRASYVWSFRQLLLGSYALYSNTQQIKMTYYIACAK